MGNYLHAELTERIIKAAYNVLNELGHGFLESVYEKTMEQILIEEGHQVRRQANIPVYFRGKLVGDFKADLIVDDLVIIELKAIQKLQRIHEAQILNYLRATEIEVGLLINFGQEFQIQRKVFANSRKRHHQRK